MTTAMIETQGAGVSRPLRASDVEVTPPAAQGGLAVVSGGLADRYARLGPLPVTVLELCNGERTQHEIADVLGVGPEHAEQLTTTIARLTEFGFLVGDQTNEASTHARRSLGPHRDLLGGLDAYPGHPRPPCEPFLEAQPEPAGPRQQGHGAHPARLPRNHHPGFGCSGSDSPRLRTRAP